MKDLEKKLKLLRRYTSLEERSLPDFFIAGTQKGGTTSLYAYLVQHPNVIGALKKEIRFFSLPNVRKKGLRWYRSHFPTIRDKTSRKAITGEATPLMHDFHAPRLIREIVPSVKLIFLLREPVKRAFSHYQHNRRREGRELLTFSRAIREESSRIKESARGYGADEWASDLMYRHYSYAHKGLYAEQLERWYKLFPREQIFVESSERFYQNPQSCLARVVSFLDLPKFEFDCEKPRNVGNYSESMPEADIQYLQEFYEGKNDMLFNMLGRKLWETEITKR